MIAWFIIGIATLAVFTFLALNATENIAAATELHSRTETVRRMESAVNSLLSGARSPNSTGLAYLPAGRISGTSYILPANLEHLAQTPFGQPIVYCPFGGSESGASVVTVPSTNAFSYNIEVATLNGANYVVGGRPSFAQVSENSNLMGWLMAARTRNDPVPSCNSVTYSPATNRFTAAGAIVRPIIRTVGPEESRDLNTREITWFVSPSGTGNGQSSTAPSQLLPALDFYRTRQPTAMRIIMANGNYSLPAHYLNMDAGGFINQQTNGTLSFQGTGGANVDQTAGSVIQLPGTLEVNGVNFDSDSWFLASKGSRLNIANASAGRIWAFSGGQASLQQNVSVTNSATDNHPVMALSGGSIAVNGTLSINSPISAIAMIGGSVSLEKANVTISRPSGSATWHAIYVNAGGTFTAENSTITFSTQRFGGIANAGTVSATNLTFFVNAPMNVVIDGLAGSRTNLNGGGIASASTNRPAYGFGDYEAASVSGANFQLRASTQCWWFDPNKSGVFSQSAAAAPGANSIVLNNVVVPALTSNSASAIQAYNSALQTNQLRANLRNANSSSWTCQS